MGKTQSSLVLSVAALDEHFANLVQLGARIDELSLKSNSDIDQAERLIEKFNEVANGVAEKIVAMSAALNDARSQAETAAQQVSKKAEDLNARKFEIQGKMEAFRLLGEKVSRLTSSLSGLQPPAGQEISDADRARIAARFSEVNVELSPLIDEAQALKQVAQDAKIKLLEQSADAMWQSLTAVRQKITAAVDA